ncbi:6575_t:CDS:2, partial [Rhizophagus irregularis]
NEIKKYNNHKIRKTSTWAVNMLKQLNELVNFIESYESQQDDSIQLIPNNPEYEKMKQHYYELDLRIQRGKIFELALRRKLEIERIYKKTGTKLYNRIKAQIALTDRNIQNAVSKYNEIIETFSYSNCDIQIIQNWKTVCDIESEFWKKYLNEEMLPNVDPLIRKGINSMLTLNRFWEYQHINILKLIEIEINTEMDIELNFTRIRYKKGIIKWIINEKLNIENQMNEFEFLLKNLNKKNIENTEDDNNEYLYDDKIDKLDIDEIELNENNEI